MIEGFSRRLLPLLAFLLLAACSSNPTPRLWEDPNLKLILTQRLPVMPYRVAVPPIELGFDQKELAEGVKVRYLISKDRDELRKDILGVLKKVGSFQDVHALNVRNPKPTDRDYLEEAWRRKDDFLLKIRLTRYENSYEGSNGWFLPNLLLWATFVFPAWWVADEQYGATVEAELSLVSVHSQKEVARKVVKASSIRDLDDFDRGWHPIGILRVPSSLDAENWEKISSVVSPYPLKKIKVDVAKFVQVDFRKETSRKEFPAKISKTLAVIAGLSRYNSYKRHNIRFAVRDAKKVYETLVGDGPGRIPGKNALLLTDEQATGANLMKAVEEFLNDRARETDTVLFYFAGYGGFGADAKGGMDAYLTPYDYDHKKGLAPTGIGFAKLRNALEKCPARNLVLFMDASFSRPGSGDEPGSRAFSELPTSDAAGPMNDLLKNRTGAVIFAAGSGQGAGEFEDMEHGLFTFYLLEGLQGKADLNRDGAVLVEELTTYVTEQVRNQSGMTGSIQEPVLVNNKGAAIRVATVTPAKEK